MKAITNLDRRSAEDKADDRAWTKLCRDAKLTARQSMLVSQYLNNAISKRIQEIESASDMSWMIALVDCEKYGTDAKRGAVRLPRDYNYATKVRNEAYGHACVDANGFLQNYDMCGLYHLKNELRNRGVEFEE
jgi:hypothetical protein